MDFEQQDNKGIGKFGWNFFQPKDVEKSIEASYTLVAISKGRKSLQLKAAGHNNNMMLYGSGAAPAPQGKVPGTRWVRHFNEIMANLVQCLMDSGTFGWPLILQKGVMTHKVDSTQGCSIYPACNEKDDCWVGSSESPATPLLVPRVSSVKASTTNKCSSLRSRTLKTVWRTLAKANSEMSLGTWQKRQKTEKHNSEMQLSWFRGQRASHSTVSNVGNECNNNNQAIC